MSDGRGVGAAGDVLDQGRGLGILTERERALRGCAVTDGSRIEFCDKIHSTALIFLAVRRSERTGERKYWNRPALAFGRQAFKAAKTREANYGNLGCDPDLFGDSLRQGDSPPGARNSGKASLR